MNPPARVRRMAFGALLVLVAGALAGGAQEAAAQWRPARSDDPVRVEAWQDGSGLRVRLAIDDGWYVYGVEAEGIGLPLQVLPAEGDEPLAVSSVGSAALTTVNRRQVPIHRGSADFVAGVPAAGVGGAVRVRWAACRGDLCVPRESRVEVGRSVSAG